MKLTDIGLLDEVFTHIDEAGKQTSFAVGPLYKTCLAMEPGVEKLLVPVDAEHAEFCITNRGVEKDRLRELMAHPEWLKKPILFVATPDGEHLLIDGTHRYVCYFALKLPNIPAYVVPWPLAERCIVDDVPQMPEDVVMADSGLATLRKILGVPSE